MFNIWQKIDNIKVLDMVPCEFPVFKPTKIYFGEYNTLWGIPKNATNKEAAIKLLLYINTSYISEMWNIYTICSSGIKGNKLSNTLETDQFERFNNYIDSKYLNGKMRYEDNSAFIFGQTHKRVNNFVKEVAIGEISAKNAMEKIKVELRK